MSNTVTIETTIANGSNVPLPTYQTEGSAGLDLSASISESVTIPVGHRRMIPTGLSLAIPIGYEGQVRPRSGLAAKHGVTVLNAPGTIDSDFRGQIQVILINHGQTEFVVTPLMRIAQLVISPVTFATLSRVDTIATTTRGSGGFGHTGA